MCVPNILPRKLPFGKKVFLIDIFILKKCLAFIFVVYLIHFSSLYYKCTVIKNEGIHLIYIEHLSCVRYFSYVIISFLQIVSKHVFLILFYFFNRRKTTDQWMLLSKLLRREITSKLQSQASGFRLWLSDTCEHSTSLEAGQSLGLHL